VEKYCRAGHATDDIAAHMHGILENYGYKQPFRICNAYCFSTATMITRTRLYVTVLHTLPVLSLYFDRKLIIFNLILSPTGDHMFLVIQVQQNSTYPDADHPDCQLSGMA